MRIICLLLVIFYSFPAYAYLDPGSTAMILHVIVGAVVGGLVMLKAYWQKFKNLFSKTSTNTNDENGATDK